MNEPRYNNDPISGRNAPAAGQPVPEGQGESRDLAAPLGSAMRGRLRFVGGASNVTIHADPTTQDLYHARFEGGVPTVEVRGGTVTVRCSRFPPFDWLYYWRERPAEVALNASIPWQLEVRGVTSRLTADLSALRLGSLNLSGGASRVEVTLPEPSGNVSVRVLGGASNVTIRRPEGVAARVHVGGGASNLTFDDQRFGAVGGKVNLQTPDYEDAVNRYDITITNGANAATIGTH